MRHILAIAQHVFREALRAQVLYVLGASGLAITGGAVLLAPIALGQVKRIVIDLGLMAMSLVGLLLLTLLATHLVARDVERRTIEVLLAKPIRRSEYVLGNYLGLALALALYVAANTAFLGLAVALATGEIDPRPLLGGGMVLLELLTLAAVAILFTSFCGSLVAAFLLTATYVAGHLAGDLHDFARVAGAPVMAWASYVVPNLASFDLRPEVVHGFALDPGRLLLAVAHGVSYAGCALTLAILVFKRRELR
jgi:ABC-type transport system involved in multi-copper enzyme maturation permease subunit